MDCSEAILKRRSVRKITDYQVSDEEIDAIVEAARWAPSWANTQVWEYIVIRDRETINKVVDTYTEKNPATRCSREASVLIVGCAKKGVSGYPGTDMETRFADWFMFDLGLSVQNLCLRAHELGLGTVIVGSLDHGALAKLLSLPGEYEAVVVLPIGKPVNPDKKGPPRKEVKDFVHRERFGNSYK
jgi:nitroreductase